MARPAAMAQQVHVELELLPARRQLEHRVMQFLERRACAEEGMGWSGLQLPPEVCFWM